MIKVGHLFAILCILLTSSCSTRRPEGETEAEVLFREAEELVERGRYILATEKLNQVKSKHPYSYYATSAELLQADILFKQENFVEATGAYIVFRDFHPRHKRLDYVIWMIGESYYKQLPSTFDRDLSPGIEAMKYYEELVALFPKGRYVEESRSRMAFIQEQFRLKERYIADFYFKTKDYKSARFRYLDILKKFQDEKLKHHAMTRILESSYLLGEKDACLKYYNLYVKNVEAKGASEFETVRDRCRTIKSGG